VETLLRDAQRVVNSRPLLYGADAEPLTPAHLVFGRELDALPPVSFPKSAKDTTLLEYSRLQKDLGDFWTIWNDLYLPSLQAYKWPRNAEPRCNELVVVKKDGVARQYWELARITRLITGKDDKIRSVEIEPLNGGQKRRRATHRLYPIEHLALAPE